ncbi:MAG: energy transducer TonB [Ferruginibacter sp.]|nr:energy transducer TonB [Ferruginibacter sp.]
MKKFCTIIVMLFVCACATAQKVGNKLPVEYDTIFTKPTVLASYPGGEIAWKKYVKKNMKYPRKAWWDAVETDIAVKLIINKEGTIDQAQHLSTAGYGFEKEAVRLVLESGTWVPATYNGTAVKSEGVLKIEFRLK